MVKRLVIRLSIFKKKKKEEKEPEEPKKKKVSLCSKGTGLHDWYKIGACKDFIGNNPCEYHPEGCSTCNDRFSCLVQSDETYNDRFTAVYYACRNCPAINMDGYVYEWVRRNINKVADIRTHSWKGMDSKLIKEHRDKWKDTE